MEKLFPLDIEAVREYGIDRWRSEVPPWPVPEKDFFGIVERVDSIYVDTILASSDKVAGELLAIYKVTLRISMFAQMLLAMQRLNEMGYAPQCSSTVLASDSLLRTILPVDPVSPPCAETVPPLGRRLHEQLQRFVMNHRRVRGTPSTEQPMLAPEMLHRLLGTYRAGKCTDIRFFYPYPVLGYADGITSGDVAEVGQSAAELADSLVSGLGGLGIVFNDDHRDSLQGVIAAELLIARERIRVMAIRLRGLPRSEILVQTLGSDNNRCLCAAARQTAHTITGCEHGESAGMFNHSIFTALELAQCDRYVVTTKEVARLTLDSVIAHPLTRDRDIDVFSLNVSYYRECWEKNAAQPLSDSIDRAMLIEYPLTPSRHCVSGAYWPYQLDLAFRIGAAVRKSGVAAVIKRHPDRLTASEGLYEGEFDEVRTEPFEEVCCQTDALIFAEIATTTFMTAILTNRTVIFFESMLADVWEEFHEPLRKRCRIVPSWFDDDGRFMFDEKSFAEALRLPPCEPDLEFAEKYLF